MAIRIAANRTANGDARHLSSQLSGPYRAGSSAMRCKNTRCQITRCARDFAVFATLLFFGWFFLLSPTHPPIHSGWTDLGALYFHAMYLSKAQRACASGTQPYTGIYGVL